MRCITLSQVKKKELTEKFIKNHVEDFNEACWDYIVKNQQLSENIIKEFALWFDWPLISRYQKLSESFIEEFSDKVDWESINKYQDLSKKFLIKYLKKIDMCWLRQNVSISNNIKEEVLLMKNLTS